MDLWVKPVILNPSTVTLGPSHGVILSTFAALSVDSAKDLASRSGWTPRRVSGQARWRISDRL